MQQPLTINRRFKHVALGLSLAVVVTGLAWSPRTSFQSPWQPDRNYRIETGLFDVAWYSSKRQTLTLLFHDGSVYEYYNVPTRVFRGFMTTSHKGGFFNGQIRAVYQYCQLR